MTAPDRPGTPDGRSTPKPLGQVSYEATQAYWNRHQAHISEPWDTLPQASQEAAETGAQAVAARLTDGYAAELAAENAKLRERLVMLLADTPFEFQPDWTHEYEDEIAKRQESASWPN